MRKPSSPETVRVRASGAVPVEVEWRGRRFPVCSVDAMWCIEGRWWLDAEREGARRRYFRLHLRHQTATLCVELCRLRTGEWRLWRIAD